MNVMKNNITIEEIKESVEYNWRKNQIIILLYAWLLIAGVSVLVPFAVIIDRFYWFIYFYCYSFLFK